MTVFKEFKTFRQIEVSLESSNNIFILKGDRNYYGVSTQDCKIRHR